MSERAWKRLTAAGTLAAVASCSFIGSARAQSLEALSAGSELALPVRAPMLPESVGRRPRPRPAPAPAPVPAPAPAAGGGSETLLTEPGDGRGQVLSLINSASSSIDLTIYELEDPQVVSALASAAQRGVNVRVIYNYYSFQQNGHDPNASYIQQLSQAGVQTKPAGQQFAITHQKTLVIDGGTAVVMTFNLAPNYFQGTRDFGVVTTDPGEVAEIGQGFEADWNGTPFSPSNPALVWSPNNSRSRLLDLINGATRSLDVYGEETSDQQSMQALIAAARRGVTVRFITAVLKSRNSPTDANAAERDALNSNGVQAKPMSSLYVHAKMILADYGGGDAKAYLGSENFSSTSLDKNRELGVIVTDSGILQSLEGTFSSDWSAN